MGQKENVINFLLNSGFQIDGSTKEYLCRIGSMSNGYVKATYPGRFRLWLIGTEYHVTVGRDTVCFYRIVNVWGNRKPVDFHNILTKNWDEIVDFVRTLRDAQKMLSEDEGNG